MFHNHFRNKSFVLDSSTDKEKHHHNNHYTWSNKRFKVGENEEL